MNSQLGIVFCVEKGILESQAKLLINSINHNFQNIDVVLFSCSPRKDFFPDKVLNQVDATNIVFLEKDLNTALIEYPIANKVICTRYIEKHFSEVDNLIFLDTDTIFLKAPDISFIKAKEKLYLRPVDNKGPGTEGDGDPNDAFWQEVFKLCGVPLPEPKIWTTVRPSLIRNYFNAGFIWANGLNGFFHQWYDDFITIVNSNLRPFGYQSRDGDDFRCLDQVALAVTATRFQEYLEILPKTYNYPIPFKPMMQDRDGHPKFDELVHIHYHKWFQHPGFLDHVTTDEEKQFEQHKWLKEHLPLQPEIDGPFKC